MGIERFIKDPKLPFAELRHSSDSSRQYKPHMHRTFCAGAVEEGEVIYRVEGRTVTLQPGSLALINPETLHSCNSFEFEKRSYTMLFLDIDWCLIVQQSLWRCEAFRPAHTFLLEDSNLYERYMRAAEALMARTDRLEKEQLLAELAERIFSKACEPAPIPDEPSLQLEALKYQLRTNLDEDVTMDRIASSLNANPYTLLRQFKAAMGITPHAYRLNCRIELAKHLLQDGADLSQVALECGFFDQSHFHRHFKAMTAVTPKEYQVNFVQ